MFQFTSMFGGGSEQQPELFTDKENMHSPFKITFKVYSKKKKKPFRKIHDFLAYTEREREREDLS